MNLPIPTDFPGASYLLITGAILVLFGVFGRLKTRSSPQKHIKFTSQHSSVVSSYSKEDLNDAA